MYAETALYSPTPALLPMVSEPTKDLLRFITCGSVDDGKSTLIGRLLYEAKSLFDDQIAVLETDSRKFGKAGETLDFALLVDGLAAEREQGITIDVAYRFFETDKRKFIVADTPGHERYTRNMATGASTADLAILLIDAQQGILPQSRRHSFILSRLGVRHIVLAVNKIDIVDYDEAVFLRIAEDYRNFSAGLEFERIDAIPISARDGDNITSLSKHTPWYDGPPLLALLENTPGAESATGMPFRMAVQSVIRPDGSFRGYAGLVTSGRIAVGDQFLVQPSTQSTRVARIVTSDGDLAEAIAGQSVVLTTTNHLDIGRGDLLVSPSNPASTASHIELDAVWMNSQPLVLGQRLLVKVGSRSIGATVREILTRIDVATGNKAPATQLALNDIGHIRIETDTPIAFDLYRHHRDTGGMLLIDQRTFTTLGIGMATGIVPPPSPEHIAESHAAMEGLTIYDPSTVRHVERHWRSLAKAVSWRITGSSDTFLLAWLFTGNVKTSAAISVAEILTKTFLYYLHERAWAKTNIGRTSRWANIEPEPYWWRWVKQLRHR